MNATQLLGLIQLTLSILRNEMEGTPIEGGFSRATALATVAARANALYLAEQGKPIDPEKLGDPEKL